MVTLTPRAHQVVRKVTAHPRLSPESGLRIAGSTRDSLAARKAPLQVRTVTEAAPGDIVVEKAGARLYLDAAALSVVDEGELDARIDAEGRVEFVLRDAA